MQRVWVMLGSDGSRAHGPRLRMRILSPSHPSIPAHDNQVWPISAARDSSEKVHCSQCVLQHCALHPARGDILGWLDAGCRCVRAASVKQCSSAAGIGFAETGSQKCSRGAALALATACSNPVRNNGLDQYDPLVGYMQEPISRERTSLAGVLHEFGSLNLGEEAVSLQTSSGRTSQGMNFPWSHESAAIF